MILQARSVYRGVLFTLRKVRNSETCFSVAEPENMMLRETKTQKDKLCLLPFYVACGAVRLIGTKSRMMGAGGGGWGVGV